MSLSAIVDNMKRTFRKELDEALIYRAIVTGLSAGKVRFRPIEATTAGTQLFARLEGFTLEVGDEIAVIGRRNPLVLGRIQRAASTEMGLDVIPSITGAGAGIRLRPGFFATNTSTVATPASNQSNAIYLGQPEHDIPQVNVRVNVQTAFVAGTGTSWCEVGIATGSAPTLNGNPSLTREGYEDVSTTFNGTGNKSVTIDALDIAAGEHVWALWGSQAGSGGVVCALLGGVADPLAAGFNSFVGSTRISTMGAGTSFAASSSATIAAWLAFSW